MSIKLVFFGTGSGKPTPHRGVSGTALFRHGDLFLFDCGEGTQTQFAKSSVRMGSLRVILLSHFHGDHVNGLPGLLGSLTLNQREDPLTVIGPRGLVKWFNMMRELNILWPSFPINLVEVEKAGVIYKGEDFDIEAHPLRHRITTWGYAFVEHERPGRFDLERAKSLGVPSGPLFGKLQKGEVVTLDDGTEILPEQVLGASRKGLKVAYCCDTIPCPGADTLAKGSDVLIHESTYPAGNEKRAKERGHSTSKQAAECAKRADAAHLILTHLSQKHPNRDEFLASAIDIFPSISVAHDLYEHEISYVE